MFGFAWLTLRQAQEAIKNGLLEEALRLLRLPALRSHKRAGELLVLLARAYAERGERHLRREDAEAAWCDLLLAESLQTAERGPDRLRHALTGLGLAELRALLLAGDTDRAEESLARLRQRGVATHELGILDEGLRYWVEARLLAARGDLAQALEAAAKAARLLGANQRLEAFQDEVRKNVQSLPELFARLHNAAGAGRWPEVVELAEQVLAVAPQHTEARALRARAWNVASPEALPIQAVSEESDVPAVTDTNQESLPPRFYLWIDGVGGYLVCCGPRLTFGQALPDARVDVPLVADVSRLHATLSRDGEGYVLAAVRPVQVNGATTTRILLQPNDRVTLGASCQFLFRQPVPGNSTARLDLVSGHRLPTSVDAVLLLAETLILGASGGHIAVPELKKPVVLFRHRDGLGLRHSGELRVNGQQSAGRTILPPNATATGEEISFAVEPAT